MIHATSHAPARRLRVLAEAAGRAILSASPLQRWPLLPVAFSVASSLTRSCARSVAQKKTPGGSLRAESSTESRRFARLHLALAYNTSRDSVHSATRGSPPPLSLSSIFLALPAPPFRVVPARPRHFALFPWRSPPVFYFKRPLRVRSRDTTRASSFVARPPRSGAERIRGNMLDHHGRNLSIDLDPGISRAPRFSCGLSFSRSYAFPVLSLSPRFPPPSFDRQDPSESHSRFSTFTRSRIMSTRVLRVHSRPISRSLS